MVGSGPEVMSDSGAATGSAASGMSGSSPPDGSGAGVPDGISKNPWSRPATIGEGASSSTTALGAGARGEVTSGSGVGDAAGRGDAERSENGLSHPDPEEPVTGGAPRAGDATASGGAGGGGPGAASDQPPLGEAGSGAGGAELAGTDQERSAAGATSGAGGGRRSSSIEGKSDASSISVAAEVAG